MYMNNRVYSTLHARKKKEGIKEIQHINGLEKYLPAFRA